MLNSISEQELQLQGLVIIEQALKKGVVHIVKNNKPRYVVLTEESYQNLAHKKFNQGSVLEMMLKKPCTGVRSKESIDSQVQDEREYWRKEG